MDRGVVIPVMWVLQAVVVGGLVVASVATRRGTKRLERVVEDLELEGPSSSASSASLSASSRGIEPLEALVDEVPYGCIDWGMQVVDGEGRVIGTVLIPSPVLN